MGHTGEFTADFANKTLTGTLVRNGYVSRSKEQKLQQFTILMQKLKVIAFLVKQTQKIPMILILVKALRHLKVDFWWEGSRTCR